MGCYDGAVLVFDVHGKSHAPIYQATVRTGKHNDPVWNIFWQVSQACGFSNPSNSEQKMLNSMSFLAGGLNSALPGGLTYASCRLQCC